MKRKYALLISVSVLCLLIAGGIAIFNLTARPAAEAAASPGPSATQPASGPGGESPGVEQSIEPSAPVASGTWGAASAVSGSVPEANAMPPGGMQPDGGTAASPGSSPGVNAGGTGGTDKDGPTQKPTGKVAYLTFDDGPSKATAQLLDILKTCDVRATFFVVGTNAEKYPDMLRRMVSEGHIVGIHSWTHNYSYIYKSMQNFLDDFNRLKDFITQVTGVAPNVCRFPGGTNNTVSLNYNSGHIMKSIVGEVGKLGFTYFDWNVSAGESGSTTPSAAEIENSVVSQCKGRDLAVILFHDTGNAGFNNAVPGIVSKLRAMGYTFETLSPGNPSDPGAVQFRPS